MTKNAQQGWQNWLATLSPAARKALTEKGATKTYDDEKDDYACWRASLSEKTRETVDQLVPTEDSNDQEVVDDKSVRYCCVEDMDGEAPLLRLFKTPQALAQHLCKLEGKDAYVVPFYGWTLRFSVGRQRYLELPDGARLMTIPLLPGGATKIIDADLLDFVPQDNFFLGPQELCDTSAMATKLSAKKNAKAIDVEFDDDDDDDDDDDEEGAYIDP